MPPACRRMEEVQQSENRATLEDLMYASVLEKFLTLGVDMLGSMDTITENRDTLESLTEGIHSKVPGPSLPPLTPPPLVPPSALRGK